MPEHRAGRISGIDRRRPHATTQAVLCGALSIAVSLVSSATETLRPNLVLIFADDLGYGMCTSDL
jgi:stage V sporulation protein SpoVS